MNNLEYIFNHFGQENQIKKLREEVEEFIEAVLSGNIDHMEEEAADITLVLQQFIEVKELEQDNIDTYVLDKKYRTIDRIRSRYYEGVEQNV